MTSAEQPPDLSHPIRYYPSRYPATASTAAGYALKSFSIFAKHNREAFLRYLSIELGYENLPAGPGRETPAP